MSGPGGWPPRSDRRPRSDTRFAALGAGPGRRCRSSPDHKPTERDNGAPRQEEDRDVDPRELLPLPVSEGPVEEGPAPSPVVCPAGLSSTCTRWVLFTNVVERLSDRSEWAPYRRAEPPERRTGVPPPIYQTVSEAAFSGVGRDP